MLTMTIKNNSAHAMTAALARTLECRDAYTAGHTQRVTEYADLLAEKLNFSTADRRRLRLGTAIHDIGKIGVPDAILKKTGPLTADEYEQMKTHSWLGADIVAAIPELKSLVDIVRHHHEHWDGWGYPDGLAGQQISPLARVTAVADAFDAMTSDRPYRPAMSAGEAFDEIQAGAGRQFDPVFANAFLRLRPRIETMLTKNNAYLEYVG